MADLRELTGELLKRARGTELEALAADVRDQVVLQLDELDAAVHTIVTGVLPSLSAAGARALGGPPAPTALRPSA